MVGVPDQCHIALSCLMRDVHAASGSQLRRRLHHGHVDRVRALGAAKDQNPRRPAAARSTVFRAVVLLEELGTNRVACNKSPPAEKRHRGLERHRRRADQPRQHTVGESGHRVLFQQQRRNATRRRREHHRSRAVAADADHQIRRSTGKDPPRIHAAERQQRHATRERRRRRAFESRAAQHVELKSLAGHDARFESPRGARERDDGIGPAMPGYRWPPVPPPAITTRSGLMTHPRSPARAPS